MFASPAFAQTAAGGAPQSGLSTLIGFAPLAILFVLFYFLILRPQTQRAKAQRAALDAIRKGDTVVTGGGLIGRVTRVDEAEVEVELGANVRVKAVKATIAEVRPAGGKPAND